MASQCAQTVREQFTWALGRKFVSYVQSMRKRLGLSHRSRMIRNRVLIALALTVASSVSLDKSGFQLFSKSYYGFGRWTCPSSLTLCLVIEFFSNVYGSSVVQIIHWLLSKTSILAWFTDCDPNLGRRVLRDDLPL